MRSLTECAKCKKIPRVQPIAKRSGIFPFPLLPFSKSRGDVGCSIAWSGVDESALEGECLLILL